MKPRLPLGLRHPARCRHRVIIIMLPLAIIAASLATVRAQAAPMWFEIDPARSVVQATATIEFPLLGYTVTTVGQGATGLAEPWFGDGTMGQFGGVLVADLDWDSSTMTLGGGSLYGRNSGRWESGAFGLTGTAPGFLGILIDDLLGFPSRAVASVRDFRADYFNAYSVTSLVPQGGAAYTFSTDHWVAVSANVDVQGQTGLGLLLGSTRFDLADRYAANNFGQTGSLAQLGGGEWELQIPLDTFVFISAGDTDVGPVYVSLHVSGDIVGTSIDQPIPSPALISQPGNDTLATAQSVDYTFDRQYHPEIGDTTLNTSTAFPHTTIEAVGDGSFDYFRFTVTEPGAVGLFDIDGATFDSELFLFDQFGNLLATNDDAPYNYGAGGSGSSLDAFLEYTFATPGEYTIAVAAYDTVGVPGGLIGSGPPPGSQYTLHISISAVVPEPSAGALAALPFAGLAWCGLRRRRAQRGARASTHAGARQGTQQRAQRRAPWLLLLALATVAASGGPRVASANPLIKPSQEFIYDEGGTYPMPYRLFTPPGADDAPESFPLVLFLHGAGERGEDNFYQVANNINGLINATQGDDYAAFLLAPQMTDFPFAGGWNANSPFDRTMEILDHVLAHYPIDPDRIYLTGLSMGGYGTFHYLAAFPDLFAAGVPLAGGGSTSTAPLFYDVPLWVFHGTLDTVVSVNNSRNMVNALINAGGSPLYTEIPTGGHDIWHSVYADAQIGQYGLYDWLFAQSKSSGTPGPLLTPEPAGVTLTASAAVACAAWLAARRRRRCGRRQQPPSKDCAAQR